MDQWRCNSNLSTRPLKGPQTPAHPQTLRTITGGHHSNSPITRTTAGTAHSRHARATIGNDRNLLARKTHGIAHNPRALETTGNALRTTAAIVRNPHVRKTAGSRRRINGNVRTTTTRALTKRHTPPPNMKRPIPNERMMPPTFNPDWPTTKQ